MDGLLSFLQDPAFENFETILPDARPAPPPSLPRGASAPAILFVDDFDQKPEEAPEADAEPDIIAPVFTEADIDAAREAGRQAGLIEGRTEHHAVQAELCAAAMAAIGDALAATRGDAAAVAQRVAEDAAAAMLALLQAALPAAAETLAGSEVAALLAVLLPALRREPDVEVRLHPATLAGIKDDLNGLCPNYGGQLKLTADAVLAPADARIIWHDGEAVRDTGKLWDDLRAALAPYALPSVAAILKGTPHEQ
jgi:flagellar biosynthesis/type III secretory pathway protein FliH